MLNDTQTQTIQTAMKTFFPVISLLLILFTGCSDNVKITGQVKFDDGEPVNFGQVCFQDDKNSFYSSLDKDGRYSLGVTSDGTGIPEGEYTVWLAGTVEVKQILVKSKKKKVISDEESADEPEYVDGDEIQRVHPKYTSPQSPDAPKFTVKKGGAKKLDFTVERPPQKNIKKK
ncbi:hypothetical protein FACS18942_01700 [Planctomycetales bacterium]|nr:hypothetical protein FACS18942_01700 [Planctomycetales bacterium]GHT37869.1 hypothetical protein FACS189427_11410 [Planctomycetales bacterium]